MRILLLHQQLLYTLSLLTAIVALSAAVDWRNGGLLSYRTQVLRGIWGLMMASELLIGIAVIIWHNYPIRNPLHLIYGVVALLVTITIIWVVPRILKANQQGRSLFVAMGVVSVVLYRLSQTGG